MDIKIKRQIKILAFMLICVIFNSTINAGAKTQPDVAQLYNEYKGRLESIKNIADIEKNNFEIVDKHIFPIQLCEYGETMVYPAFDNVYNRLVLFWADNSGEILYKTDQLETNVINRGALKQPTKSIVAISYKDINNDSLMDVILITSCINDGGAYADKAYKVGDVLFQNKEMKFYRDYRISDKINRFGMNKSIDSIAAFVKDGDSTEFLYTAPTLRELQNKGFRIIQEQCYFRNFAKLGRLQVVPGVYKIAYYDVFMVYLVNEQGYILSSLQPMGSYDNLYALKGINCKDIDGDGLKDIVILARYSYEDIDGEIAVESDYSIYYQRTGGFFVDNDIKQYYKCKDNDTMEALITNVRAYWGWKIEND